jgi:hypothetical protein
MKYIYNIVDNANLSRSYIVKLNFDDDNQALSIGSSRLKTCNVRIMSKKELNLL